MGYFSSIAIQRYRAAIAAVPAYAPLHTRHSILNARFGKMWLALEGQLPMLANDRSGEGRGWPHNPV